MKMILNVIILAEPSRHLEHLLFTFVTKLLSPFVGTAAGVSSLVEDDTAACVGAFLGLTVRSVSGVNRGRGIKTFSDLVC